MTTLFMINIVGHTLHEETNTKNPWMILWMHHYIPTHHTKHQRPLLNVAIFQLDAFERRPTKRDPIHPILPRWF